MLHNERQVKIKMKIEEVARFTHVSNRSIYPEPIDDYLWSSRKLFSFTSHTGERFTVYTSEIGGVFAAADSRGMVQMAVEGEYEKRLKGKSTFWISLLQSATERTLRASDFYTELILNLNLVLVSDKSLSDAGAAVWQRLSRDPRLKTYLLDEKNKKIWDVPTSKKAEYVSRMRDPHRESIHIRYVATAK